MSQRDFVLNKLRADGSITRNFCLQNYISRLGAIVCDLSHEGYDIEGQWLKTDKGKDFIYILKQKQETLF